MSACQRREVINDNLDSIALLIKYICRKDHSTDRKYLSFLYGDGVVHPRELRV